VELAHIQRALLTQNTSYRTPHPSVPSPCTERGSECSEAGRGLFASVVGFRSVQNTSPLSPLSVHGEGKLSERSGERFVHFCGRFSLRTEHLTPQSPLRARRGEAERAKREEVCPLLWSVFAPYRTPHPSIPSPCTERGSECSEQGRGLFASVVSFLSVQNASPLNPLSVHGEGKRVQRAGERFVRFCGQFSVRIEHLTPQSPLRARRGEASAASRGEVCPLLWSVFAPYRAPHPSIPSPCTERGSECSEQGRGLFASVVGFRSV
jgi:hypothetical protein